MIGLVLLYQLLLCPASMRIAFNLSFGMVTLMFFILFYACWVYSACVIDLPNSLRSIGLGVRAWKASNFRFLLLPVLEDNGVPIMEGLQCGLSCNRSTGVLSRTRLISISSRCRIFFIVSKITSYLLATSLHNLLSNKCCFTFNLICSKLGIQDMMTATLQEAMGTIETIYRVKDSPYYA